VFVLSMKLLFMLSLKLKADVKIFFFCPKADQHFVKKTLGISTVWLKLKINDERTEKYFEYTLEHVVVVFLWCELILKKNYTL